MMQTGAEPTAKLMRRHFIPTAFIGLAALAAAKSACPQTDDAAAWYQVTVRQVEGYDSVPAHMTCALNKICRGVTSVSTTGGHLRVFVTAVIDGGNVYVGFRTEERDLSCNRGQDFMHLALGPPPTAAHAYAFVCDTRPPLEGTVQGEAETPSAPKTTARLLAVLRIDVQPRDDANGR